MEIMPRWNYYFSFIISLSGSKNFSMCHEHWKKSEIYVLKSESEVAQSCPILRDPMDCSLPDSFVQGIFPGKSTEVGRHW